MERRIHWMSWEKLCIPKIDGGLGFRNLYAFHLSLLAKQGWRMLMEPHSLVARVFKAKYYPNGPFSDTLVNAYASYCWKSISAMTKVISLGSRWQVGSGNSLRIWEDPWIPLPFLFWVSSSNQWIANPSSLVS